MNWPSHTDYQDAMQNPSVCFQEPELQGGEAKTDMLGLPRVMSGNFASVYELHCNGKRWAIRCFVRQVSGQQGRYARLSQHLNSLTLPWLVKFEYMLKGILVKGEGYPIVKMQWVEGSPLNTWVEENLRNPEALRKIAADWRVMMKDLAQHKLAHGDLQHGNVMVTPENELRLVDYDGMYAPVFGRGRAPELGHINFQHPRRTAEFYQEDLDNFSALVIYTSLLALAAEPELWDKHYTVDNLVLSSADFKNPLNSPVFEKLRKSPDAKVQQLAKLLEKCCMSPVENVPDFLAVMDALDKGTLESLPMKTPVPAQNISFSRPAPEAPATPGSRPAGSRPAPAAPAGQNVSRPGYEGGATVPTQALKQSRPAPQQSRPAPAYPAPEQKSGIPVWVWGVVALIIALIIGLILFVNRPSPADQEENSAQKPKQVQTAASDSEPAEEPVVSQPPATPPPAQKPPGSALTSTLKLIPLGTMKGHGASVDALAFSPDGKWLASGSADKTVKIWDAKAGVPKRTLNTHGETVQNLFFLNDGKTLSGVGSDNAIRFWDANSGELQRKIEDYKSNLFPVALSPDGRSIATGVAEDRKSVRLVDVSLGSVKRSFANHNSWVRAVTFSPDGKLLATVCHDDSVNIWDIGSGRLVQSFVVTGNALEAPVFSANGRLLVTGSDEREIKIWDVQSGRPHYALTGHTGAVKACAFSPDGKLLASGSADNTLKIWDVSSGTEKQTLQGHSQSVNSLVFAANSSILVSGSMDQTIKLWEIQR